jgi:RNA polymerase sigma factor (sigma-70 family)
MDTKISMEDVFRDWDSRILKTLVGAGIPYSDVEDVKSDVYLSMVRRSACEKYDPKKAKCFSTYMYVIIHSIISNYFRDRGRKRRIPPGVLDSIESEVCWDNEGNSVLLSDTLYSFSNQMSEVEQRDFVDKILEELELPEYQCGVAVVGNKKISLREVVTLLLKGFTLSEIARQAEAKVQSVQRCLLRLRQLRVIRKYHQEGYVV